MNAKRLFLPAAVTSLALIAAALAFSLSSPPAWEPDYPILTSPLPYYTAVEALKAASPLVASWKPDAMVVALHTSSSPGSYPSPIREDGRTTSWTLMVASPSAGVVTYITLVDDVTYVVGRDGQPEDPLRFDPIPLPLDDMLDSDRAIEIAFAQGATGLPISIGRRLPYTDSNRRQHPLSWVLEYGEMGAESRIVIHALTGEVLQNDFD